VYERDDYLDARLALVCNAKFGHRTDRHSGIRATCDDNRISKFEMNATTLTTVRQLELRFQSLFDSGRGYSVPCDLEGHVDLDQLSDRARRNYLYARAMVGRDLAVPAVRPAAA
jgi:hypothetical protein